MGLRDALRRAASGGYEETSTRTACSSCGREYTASDPMVQVAIVAGEDRERLHRSCVKTVRDRRRAEARADAEAASVRMTSTVQAGDRAGFASAMADEGRARQALRDLGG